MSGMSDLVFDIFAIDRASAVFARVGESADATAEKVERGSAVMSKALLGAGAVAVGLGLKSVTMAASFDASMTRLVTTAGESQAGLKVVSQGVLDMAGKVGYTAQELATAMYQVESGGFHGAQALNVLKVAAEGARVEGANVTDVAHALGGALNDYAGTSLTATEATNAMTAAVGHGMMTFQDLAEAMPKIGARAAAARVTFAEMTAALGTMTRDGLPATVAATYLGQTIGQLAAPTARARIEMQGLGINATAVAQTITSGSGHGLGDALQMLYDGIQKHLVGGGLVSVDTFKKMSSTTTAYQQVLAKLPPSLQTNIQALATMSGGVRSFQGVLMLGGQHAQQYADTLGAVNDQITKGGTTVAGFAEVQKNLATQWANLKGSASALGVEIGNDLMPAALGVTHVFQDFFGFLQANKGTVETLGVTVVSVAGAMTAWKVAALGVAGAEALATVASTTFAESQMGIYWGLVRETFAVEGAAAGFEMLGAAMSATPFGLIATAIGGLAFGAIELFHNSSNAESAASRLSAEIHKTNTQGAQQEFTDLAASLDKVTGAYTDSSRAAVEHSLRDANGNLLPYVKTLQDEGLSIGTITSALMGEKNARLQVAAAMQLEHDHLRSAQAEQARAAQAVTDAQNLLGKRGGSFAAVNAAQAQLDAANADVASIKTNMNDINTALGTAAKARDVVISQSLAVNGLSGALSLTRKQLATEMKLNINNTDIPNTLDGLGKIVKALGLTKDQVKQLADGAGVSFASLESAASNAGDMVAFGLANGINANAYKAEAAVAALAGNVDSKMRQILQIHSPSKRTQTIGEYVVDGLVVGMTRSQHLAEEAAHQIATAMHKSLMQGLQVEKLQLGFDLSAAQANLSKINSQVAAATTWADSFKDNVFTQNLATAATTYKTKNGIQYAMTGSGVDAGATIASMIAYEKTQATKNIGLDMDVQKLRKLGLSAGLISQMQQGGDAAIPEIQALASATAAQIQQMNALYNSSTAHLQDAGAYATTGKSLHTLHQEQHNDARTVSNIQKAIRGVKLQIADGGHALRIT